MQSARHFSGGIQGTVYIQPATQRDQVPDIRLRIAYATTSPFRVVKSNYVRSEESFDLDLPDLQKGSEHFDKRPCLGVFVGLEIRPGLNLENWAMSTENLDIVVADGVSMASPQRSYLQVHEDSTFNAVRGKVKIPYWSSRRTIVEVVSGGISGAFALRDVLLLKSTSGHIDVAVDPKQADPEKRLPAEFHAVSVSGSIDVDFPTAGDFPPRDFRTRLETVSSSIHGTYIAGTSLSAHTSSGTIGVQLLPYYMDQHAVVSIHTESNSGGTKLKILPPLSDDWPSRRSEHSSSSQSGSIEVTYPHQWEGVIEGQTLSGSISIQGKDVEMNDRRRSWNPVGKHIVAHKGTGPGHMGCETVSGSIRVRVGDS